MNTTLAPSCHMPDEHAHTTWWFIRDEVAASHQNDEVSSHSQLQSHLTYPGTAWYGKLY